MSRRKHEATGERLRRIAKHNERLADIADALEPTFGEVELSPLSAWEVQIDEDEQGNPIAMPLDEYVRRFNEPNAAAPPGTQPGKAQP